MLISYWVQSRHVVGLILLLLTASLLYISLFASTSADARSHQQQATTCSYYDPRPHCTEIERNARRKKFGLPKLEQLRRRHEQELNKIELIVGTVAIKQRGGLALVFQRDANGMPSAEIRRMLWDGKSSQYEPLYAKIPEAIWSAVLAKGKALKLVHATDEALVCGADFTIELVDGAGDVRAPVGDSCGNQPRGVYFDILANAAIAQLPHCAALVTDSDWAADKLDECFALRGDKMVAAKLYNALHTLDQIPFWEANGRADPSDLRPLFSDEIEFSWAGIPLINDSETAAKFWTGSWLFPFEFQYDAIDADSAGRVRIDGRVVLEHRDEEGSTKERSGTFSSIWLKGPEGTFRMRRFSYSPKTRKTVGASIK